MQFQQIKRSLEPIFADIVTQTQNGELPSEESVNDFLRLTTRMLSMADESWIDECVDFHHLAKELFQVVKKGSLEEAIQLVEALDTAQAYCHENFRY